MGALSSWALLALTHHVIVRVAAHRVGISHFYKYAILGDDIVIADRQVAASYQAILKDLGVDISLQKSIVSERGGFEFAKRLVTPEREYTPLGCKLLLLATRNWKFVPNLYLDLCNKGFVISPQFLDRSLASLTFSPLIKDSIKLLTIGPTGHLSNVRGMTKPAIHYTYNTVSQYGSMSNFQEACFYLFNERWMTKLTKVEEMVRDYNYVDNTIITNTSAGYGAESV